MKESLAPLFASIGFIVAISILAFVVAILLFQGWCYKRIAERTDNLTYAHLWWIPFVNVLIPISIAEKPQWWIVIMLFVPIANIVCSILVWIEVAKKCGKSDGWGVVAAIIWIVGVPYLAFSET